MGFMDKAKKMAEQAQAKLDEAQQAFNERQGQGNTSPPTPTPGTQSGAPPVEYDQHGRPTQPHSDARGESATPPHGDPLTPEAPAAAAPATPHEDAPAESSTPPHGDPLSAEAPQPKAPPPSGGTGMTSGDPLGG